MQPGRTVFYGLNQSHSLRAQTICNYAPLHAVLLNRSVQLYTVILKEFRSAESVHLAECSFISTSLIDIT